MLYRGQKEPTAPKEVLGYGQQGRNVQNTAQNPATDIAASSCSHPKALGNILRVGKLLRKSSRRLLVRMRLGFLPRQPLVHKGHVAVVAIPPNGSYKATWTVFQA